MKEPSSRPVFRFAPSPNGGLHLGHALSALLGYEMALRHGGRFLLRIEDIDITRCREEFVAGILNDLDWLGIRWEEPVRRQSQHFAEYRVAAERLVRAGLAYPCFATRGEIAAAVTDPPALDPDGSPLYPGLYRHVTSGEVAQRVAEGEPHALRLDMCKAIAAARDMAGLELLTFTAFDAEGARRVVAAQPERWGDAVIVRKDIPASYHLAVVLDDALQGVTHVTRGEDLLPATDLHRVLQVLLGLPAPLYHHHRLIRDADGRKLSKSARDETLAGLRATGVTPNDVRRLVGL